MRSIVQTLLLAAVFWIGLRSFFLMGLVAPVVVEGSSMAPGLVGSHWVLDCKACGEQNQFAPEPFVVDNLTCAACSERLAASEARLATGDRVCVDRRTGWLTAPRRWERVVVRNPQDTSRYCVKRVVGLPGETVEFRAGRLVIDGELAEKTREERLASRILVCREVVDDPNRFRLREGVRDSLSFNHRLTRQTNAVTALMIESVPSPPAGFVVSVWRDVYYEPAPAGWPQEKMTWRLSDDEYFLVGDNQAVSLDSRTWQAPGVPRRLFVGRVVD